MDGRLGSFPSHVITTAATLPDSPYANEIKCVKKYDWKKA